MSALLLKKQADYLVHDSYTVETEDHEDHTFNGVMFDVEVLDRRPVQALVVDSIHVRGGLGQMSVWCVEGGRRGVEEKPNAWTRAFSRHVNASWRDFTSLKLEPPLILLPGKTYGLYVHSADQGDDGVVYDNQRDEICHEDEYIRVFPGLAHLSPDPFGADGPWWGSPWRRRRAFVGKLSYGARYVLWRPVPAAHTRFDPTFRRGVVAAFYALTMGWGGLAPCGNQQQVCRAHFISTQVYPRTASSTYYTSRATTGLSRRNLKRKRRSRRRRRHPPRPTGSWRRSSSATRTTTRASTTSATRTTPRTTRLMTTFTWPQ